MARSWSVRGIYEGYAGWFGGDAAETFPEGRDSISPELVKLAGGPKAIADEAHGKSARRPAGKLVEALNR